MNPWQRLEARVPSVFSTDTYFTTKKPQPKKAPEMDMGVLSPAGERDYLLRQATRRRAKAEAQHATAD
jgi:hypothetical protein